MMSWYCVGKAADILAGKPSDGVGPSFSKSMDIAAIVLLLIIGSLLQLVIGRPVVRRLSRRQAALKDYCKAGFLIGLALLALIAGLLALGRPDMAEVLSAPVLMAASVVVASLVLSYGAAGTVERHEMGKTLKHNP
ncbi:hypothetical protein Cflav_PD4044 [Pedosphaera parvula Ellin514]|uniref:Uncharacterized protein n=2 Tax=Pedosphaera TaxID=1032526 RepID=B9XGV4_PEDPL|nr:hypothetical protein Cflav_PD4044 [Pedosphaera parvula Ellin514]